MKKYSFNREQISEKIELLLNIVLKQPEQGEVFPISFSSGYYRETEYYKYSVFSKGQEMLSFSEWKESDIGTGTILEKIKKAFEVGGNLIDYRTDDFFNKAKKDIVYSEKVIYDLYCSIDEAEAFKAFTDFFGKRYDRMGYLMFLKDCTRFLPIRPEVFKQIFKILEIETGCTGKCTWDNYLEFCEIIKYFQGELQQVIKHVTLLDAHSFVWSMYLLEQPVKDVLQNDSKFAEIKRPKYSLKVYDNDEDIQLLNSLKDGVTKPQGVIKYTNSPKIKPDPVIRGKTKVYPRDRKTAEKALYSADYKCEINKSHPTFTRKSTDTAYTEPHHLIPMMYQDNFDNSLDHVANIVSLCSNCHNCIHYGKESDSIVKRLFFERKERLKSAGIEVTLEKLLEFYHG